MEKKKTKTSTRTSTKSSTKSTKKPTKKVTNKKKTKVKKGFTLIELLAVIIILGILMIVAIPAVTSYINSSRKSSYVATAKEVVSGARNEVNSGKLQMYDTETTYYIPASYIKTEGGLKSPYGDFKAAYVGVIYNGSNYRYYWISVDETGQGVKDIKDYDKLEAEDIKSDISIDDIENIVRTTGIGDRQFIKILDVTSGQWVNFNAEDNVSEEGGSSNSYYLYYTDEPSININYTIVKESDGYHINGILNGYDYSDVATSVYTNATDALNSRKYVYNPTYTHQFFLRLKVVDDTIKDIDLGYAIDGKIYYLDGLNPSAYQKNKETLLKSFGNDKCTVSEDDYQTACKINGIGNMDEDSTPGLHIYARSDGALDAFDDLHGTVSWNMYSSWSCNLYESWSWCVVPW